MRLSELYKKAVEIGMKYDPRDGDAAKSDLEAVKKDYEALSDEERALFDRDALWNPYLDSRPIAYYEHDPELRKIMVSLEPPGSGEVNIAREVGADVFITHHPQGRALAGLHNVLEMQIGIWKRYGVEINPVDSFANESSLRRLYSEAERESREDNQGEITEDMPDVLRYYRMPWICFHTAADNCATTYLQNKISREQPSALQDVIDLLHNIPEYALGTRELIGPRIVVGSKRRKAGKIVVDMTGGEEAPTEIFSSFSDSGIKTILCMHVSREWYEEAAKHHIQIISAGHAPSDTLGMNLLLDEIIPAGIDIFPPEIDPSTIRDYSKPIMGLGGFRRFSHKSEDWNKINTD